jgi:hypothetical protein
VRPGTTRSSGNLTSGYLILKIVTREATTATVIDAVITPDGGFLDVDPFFNLRFPVLKEKS